MIIGIFGQTGCGKSVLGKSFLENGLPASIDINPKNLKVFDIDDGKDLESKDKKHFCFISQDSSYSGYDYRFFDFLILGSMPLSWSNDLPDEIQSSFKEMNEALRNKFEFAIFQKQLDGQFVFVEITSFQLN